jgi:hypothetical protein
VLLLERRIQRTLQQLVGFAAKLDRAGYSKTAQFVRTETRATVVFAELA